MSKKKKIDLREIAADVLREIKEGEKDDRKLREEGERLSRESKETLDNIKEHFRRKPQSGSQ